jgi:hypothetical protein
MDGELVERRTGRVSVRWNDIEPVDEAGINLRVEALTEMGGEGLDHVGGTGAAGVTGVLNSLSTNYVRSATYAAHGAPMEYRYDNNLWRDYTYDPRRLQPLSAADTVSDAASNLVPEIAGSLPG